MIIAVHTPKAGAKRAKALPGDWAQPRGATVPHGFIRHT